MPQPVIARVHGIATAAGCQLVSMCDLAVASDKARFALPGVNVGVFCSTPAVGVARNIGRKRALEMLLTGELVRRAHGSRLGPRQPGRARSGRSTPRWHGWRASSSPGAATSSRRGKRAFYRQIDQPLEGAYATTTESMASSMLEPDAAEGIDAFIEKRPPHWPER